MEPSCSTFRPEKKLQKSLSFDLKVRLVPFWILLGNVRALISHHNETLSGMLGTNAQAPKNLI